MPLIDKSAIPYLSNNLVANYDENGDGTGVNGQPLQVTYRGGLQSSTRLEIEQLQGTFSASALSVAHDEVGPNLENLMSQMYSIMQNNGYVYAYNVQTFVTLDQAHTYNLYIMAWLSNY